MTLDSIDWRNITQKQAARLIPAANAREQSIGRKYNDGKASEAEWLMAFTLWEDLRVFAICGERPKQQATE